MKFWAQFGSDPAMFLLGESIVGTEQTRDARRTDGRTDRRSETNIPPNNFVVWGCGVVSRVEYGRRHSGFNF